MLYRLVGKLAYFFYRSQGIVNTIEIDNDFFYCINNSNDDDFGSYKLTNIDLLIQ